MKHAGLSQALFIDFYELTMAQAFQQSGHTATSTFSLFIRNYPPDRGYFVLAGLADILDYLEGWRLSSEDLEYLKSLNRFADGFLEHLRQLRFTGAVRAMREGSIFFIDEPVLEVTAPVIEAQLLETFLINQVNLQTILATKASRIVHAAQGRHRIDFAARRTHGIDAADKFASVSYLVGFDATSNTTAGALYGVPLSGTMAHSYIMTFDNESESFRQYASSFPDTSTFLVDTYDTLEGIEKAIAIAREMRERGDELLAIRLDSGAILELSRKARAMLDEAGLPAVQIFASGGLDEFEVDELLRAGAPIDGFGIGTKVGVSADAPWTDCVYKLVEYAGRPVLKLSAGKQTLPGPKQVFRFRDPAGIYLRDVIAQPHEQCSEAEPLLESVMAGGRRSRPDPTLEELRLHFRKELACLPEGHKRLRAPDLYDVQISEGLLRLQERVVRETRERNHIP